MTQHKSNASKFKQEKRAPKKITKTYLHNSGLYYLERFSASKNHFHRVMSRKIKKSCLHHTEQDYQACLDMLDAVITDFIRAGLLDDQTYAKGLAQSLRRQGQSRNNALRKMSVKGVEPQHAANALEQVDEFNSDPEFQAALRLTQRKRIGYYAPAPHEDLKKPLGIMARAGFSYEISMRALRFTPADE